MPMKKPAQHFIAEVPRSLTKVGMTIGIDLGDVWSHYCTLNEDGEVVGRAGFVPAHREGFAPEKFGQLVKERMTQLGRLGRKRPTRCI